MPTHSAPLLRLLAAVIGTGCLSCALAAPPEAVVPETGWWWNPEQPGRGFFIERSGNRVGVLAMLYAADGRTSWSVAAAAMPCSWTYSGQLTNYRGGQTLTGSYRAAAAAESPSSLVLQFSSSTAGTLSWQGEDLPITRLTLPQGNPETGPFAPESGWWWDATQPGRGFLIEMRNGSAFIVVATYDDDGAPIWFVSNGPMASFDQYQGPLARYKDGQTLGGSYRAPVIDSTNAGEIRLRFITAGQGLLSLAGGPEIAITRFPLMPAASGPLLEMPISLGQAASGAFGVNPFGAHIGDHAPDGHPGWDIEFAPGSTITAPMSGRVDSLIDDKGNTGIAISTTLGSKNYRVDLGIGTPVAGLAVGNTVTVGQPLGTLPIYTRMIGTQQVTYSQTHFQFDDFSYNVGLTNSFAKSPEDQLSPAARRIFDALWKTSRYNQEICEPYPTNPRSTQAETHPKPRSWTQYRGTLSPQLQVSCDTAKNLYTYALKDATGTTVESGTLTLQTAGVPTPTLDLAPSGGGPVRRGLYEVSCNVLKLDYGAPGAARPADLSKAATYTTD